MAATPTLLVCGYGLYPPYFGTPTCYGRGVRDDELRRVLTEANPWWRAAASGGDPTAWTASHRLLLDRARHDLGYRPPLLADVAGQPVGDVLAVVTGPRRIGKSVALLDCAARLCARTDVDPRQVLHVPCDGMRDRDLRRVLTLGRELTRSVDAGGHRRRVWLLDEVSAVTGWTAVLKAARDGSAFGDDTVVATGSRWAEGPEVVANLLAGRAGTSQARRVRHVLPMTFRDYLAATRPRLARPAAAHPAHLQHTGVAERLAQVQFDVDAYDLAWQDYLTCGGFPRAVAEHARTGAVSTAYLRDLQAWLRSDVDPGAPPDSVPLLLAGIGQRSSSPLNSSRTAQALGYPNRAFFDRRIARLVTSFAALPCPQRNDHADLVPGSQTKLYLTDPLLCWLPAHLRAGLPEPDMTTLTETVIAVALARAIDDLQEGRWISGDTIGYARTGSGNEIDLSPIPVPTPGGAGTTTPIEAKWVDTGWRNATRVIDARYNHGIIATKSVLDLNHATWAVPAPLLALLLN